MIAAATMDFSTEMKLEQMRPAINHVARNAHLVFVMTIKCHRGQAVKKAKDLQAMLLFPISNEDSPTNLGT